MIVLTVAVSLIRRQPLMLRRPAKDLHCQSGFAAEHNTMT